MSDPRNEVGGLSVRRSTPEEIRAAQEMARNTARKLQEGTMEAEAIIAQKTACPQYDPWYPPGQGPGSREDVGSPVMSAAPLNPVLG